MHRGSVAVRSASGRGCNAPFGSTGSTAALERGAKVTNADCVVKQARPRAVVRVFISHAVCEAPRGIGRTDRTDRTDRTQPLARDGQGGPNERPHERQHCVCGGSIQEEKLCFLDLSHSLFRSTAALA